ncbi:50S ribosomal protein L25/general stress protein Ctc [Alkalisalibacterium limincola]|uniref:Large ribosomal subunit protein bL25 n=1 Tax=Alkalisalibacterium limincola TaxID=2699169 RepID=A0A5C8L037_9GAMM|nr:50S ribosomal protein L25/general stress protein Ctc [Alkalisalibacterium limincola]TXK65145.1 50S ribosomal protein L25/general stress protein Ctc [Alkalisalibacterium limincola]
MSDHKIFAAPRGDQGKGASRRLRRSGQVPAIVYGGDADPVAIQIDHNKLLHIAENEWFYAAVIDLEVEAEGKKGKATSTKVLLRDLQRHPFKAQIMHVDFMRVDESHAIKVAVPLHFLNEDTSPAGKSSGVVVSHEMNEVLVSCMPKDLPEFLEVDLADLELGGVVHLSEIKLPKGVEIPELKLGPDHDHAVVTAKRARVEAEETEDTAETKLVESGEPIEEKKGE